MILSQLPRQQRLPQTGTDGFLHKVNEEHLGIFDGAQAYDPYPQSDRMYIRQIKLISTTPPENQEIILTYRTEGVKIGGVVLVNIVKEVNGNSQVVGYAAVPIDQRWDNEQSVRVPFPEAGTYFIDIVLFASDHRTFSWSFKKHDILPDPNDLWRSRSDIITVTQ